MKRWTGLILTLILTTTVMSQSFDTPERALKEHEDAFRARDVERFLSSIDFRQEAVELLSSRNTADSSPTDAEIIEVAASRKEVLRKSLQKFQFKDRMLDHCDTLQTVRESEVEVRFILSCRLKDGGAFFSVRVMYDSTNWHVVRGERRREISINLPGA